MRILLLISLCLISHVMFGQHYSSFIKDLPAPNRVVNDFGGFFTPTQKSTLENNLVSYRNKTGNAIVIITLSTLTDHKTGTTWSVEETALQYFNKWGIGDRNKNNGVLLLLSKDPRRVRITTGTGVEKVLTDNECQRIINETIVPSFKTGKFYTGIKEGVSDIEAILDNKIQPETDVVNPAMAPVVTQPQAQSQYAYSQGREPTLAQKIFFLLVFALTVWLRARYLRSQRVGKYDANGASTDSSTAINIQDYVRSFGWTFMWMLKIVFGIFILMWMLFRRRGGGGGYRSSYDNGYEDGYDRGRSSGGRSFLSSGSSGGRSSSGGSSSGSSSFGGGSSSGGGATGSW
jgi:uncharacterized protein